MTDLPPLTYGRVVGRFVAGVADSDDAGVVPDVVPLAGTVTFTLSAASLRVVSASPVPTTVYPQPVTASLDADGYLTQNGSRGVSLLATDDPSTNPTDLQYTVSMSLWTPDGNGVNAPSWRFALPGGTEVDLTQVAPIETPAANTIILKGERGDPGPNTVPTVQAVADAVNTAGPAREALLGTIAAVGTAKFASSLAPAIDLLGDSISAQCGGTFPSGAQPSGATYPPTSAPQARGYITYALTLLGQRLRFGTNFGIGGTTAAQMVARVADVLTSASPIVHVYAGTNDIGNGRTATETKISLLSIYKALRAAGREVTTATIAPTVFIAGSAITNAAGIAAGVTSFTAPAGVGAGDILTLGPGTANAENVTVQTVTGPSSGVYTITLTAATTKSHARGDLFRNVTRIARLHDVNQWIIDYSRGRYVDPNTGNVVVESAGGVHLVDWHSLNADPATGQPFGSIQVDGTITTVAQNPYVGVVDGVHPGQDFAHRMGHALAVVLDRILPPAPVRTGDNTDAGNLLTNGRAVGNTSGRPTGWSVITSVGTFTATPTKVARADGVPGEYAQLAIGPGNTGQGQYRVGDVSGLTFDGVTAYTLEVEFETDANLLMQASPPGGGRPLAASIEFRSSSGSLGSAHSHFTASSTDGAGSLWDASGVLSTGPYVPPATATRVLADVVLQGIDTGTVRIKTARLRKVA